MDESVKLRDLEPEFIRRTDGGWQTVERIEDAQGVRFLCPRCFRKNGGRVGTHAIICWSRSRGVPDDAQPGPGRWQLIGTSLDDLTLGADPPSKTSSVKIACWHGHITKGQATLGKP